MIVWSSDLESPEVGHLSKPVANYLDYNWPPLIWVPPFPEQGSRLNGEVAPNSINNYGSSRWLWAPAVLTSLTWAIP